MTKKSLPTLKEIRTAHAWKRDYERYLPASRYVFRPVGFFFTWISIRAGLSSEVVSWLSGLVGLIGCLFLLSTHNPMLPVGIGLLLLFNLLDCVDGSMARVMNTQNPYGRFLDSLMGFIDMAFWAVIGIMAYHHQKLLCFPDPIGYGSVFWLTVGGLTCYFSIMVGYIERIFDELVRDDWDQIKSNTDKDSESIDKSEITTNTPHEKTLPSGIRGIIQTINTNLRVRETHYFLLVLAYIIRTVDLFLILFLIYYLLHTLSLVIIYSLRGRQTRNSKI